MIAPTSGSAQLVPLTGVQGTQLAPVNDVGYALNDWRRLRQPGNWAFADYARFLIAYPGWPGETAMRRSAERAMRPGENAATVIAFFRNDPPATATGHARLAEAFAEGRQTEAIAAARRAWSASGLAAMDEIALYQRFGASFTSADHDARVDRLLIDRDPDDAARMLPSTSAARRAVFAARIAMQKRSPDTEALYNAVIGQVTIDAGLMQDRVRYLREANWQSAARQLMARPHRFTYLPVDPGKWYELKRIVAQDAANDRQFAQAYEIARQVDDALPAGTALTSQSLQVRDEYTNLTWLAGTLAMRALNRPAEAVVLFDKYSQGGRSLQVLTKGAYWAGRAAAQAGQLQNATTHFARAAAYPDLFYGQLAHERLGRAIPVPLGQPQLLPTPAQRTAFANKPLVRAVRLLGSQGRRDEQALFVRSLSEALDNDGDRLIATELSRQIGRQDLAVWTARSSRNDGSPFYFQAAYPTISGAGISEEYLWSISHGITRQESSFDRTAVSHAGARGMMQLMPGTAREQSGKLGTGYDLGRLTSDPAYNVMLGSSYFRRLLDQWGGNYVLAVASYNAGAGNVRKWVNRNGDPRRPGTDVIAWIEDIPFSETRGYVQRVLENTVVYDRMNPRSSSPRQLSHFLGKSRLG
ncbi:lytic transglycosylase domain-containing protein [Sphingomonas sp. LHG3406-1]|uniref:lytic transglycosylase domain-containing protein n=1 Tax=Sphingomonas sp. LHG3406-1 TaxID=2804617 RepID=UPI00263645B1|nr:lytic transglycosylase domain-containing protein [Sphingomonas sp. LHG3406-1]